MSNKANLSNTRRRESYDLMRERASQMYPEMKPVEAYKRLYAELQSGEVLMLFVNADEMKAAGLTPRKISNASSVMSKLMTLLVEKVSL